MKSTVAQVFQIDTSFQTKELILDNFLSKNHSGIQINNIKYSGLDYSKGSFYYKSKLQMLPPYGIVLSTGKVLDVLGPNYQIASTENHLKGDNDLSKIINSKTFDSSVIEFDFISFTDSISFIFQFASEEYPEYVKKGVSDIFGFFITNTVTSITQNIAIISKNGTPITIDLINSNLNRDYYIPNNNIEYEYTGNKEVDLLFYENSNLFQFDGFTKPISTGIKLKPFIKYHFKMAIADVGDRKFDSWIFMKGNSFSSCGEKIELSKYDIESYLRFSDIDSLTIETNDDIVKILLPIYFPYNSYEIPEYSKLYLDKLFNVIYYSNNDIVINGYADTKGTNEYNLKLSQQRADQIKQYLIKMGIQKERLESIGKGEILSNKEDQESRKVEIQFIKKGS